MSQFSTDDISDIIKPFWDNPNSENLDKYLKVFRNKRPWYNNFVFDRGSFLEQVEDYIKEHAVYTVKDRERAAFFQIMAAQPIEVDVNNTDYSFNLMYDTNKY